MISRRGFLQAILAAGIAPAIVRAESLMPVIARVPAYMTATEVLRRREEWVRAHVEGMEQLMIYGWSALLYRADGSVAVWQPSRG